MLKIFDLERYARQAIMPDIGEEGQARLLAARVLLVGAGGLGSPAGFYLAAAGIGHVTIIDDEQVEPATEPADFAYTASVGIPKVAPAYGNEGLNRLQVAGTAQLQRTTSMPGDGA